MLKPIAATLLVTAAMAVVALPVRAADSSGSLTVRGTVEARCTVEVQDSGVTLDLVKGAKSVTVGRITESCNDPDGYRITFASENGGQMVSGGARVPYRVSYDDARDRSLSGELVLNRKEAAFGESSDLKVSVDGSAERVAGAYADVITVTIAAN